MSRPEARIRTSGWEASGAGPSPAASASAQPAPVRVLAERLSLGEAHAAEVAEAERRAADLRRADLRAGHGAALDAPPVTAPVPFLPSTPFRAPSTAAPSVAGAPDLAPSVPTVAVGAPDVRDVPARVAEPGLPVRLDVPPRRSGVAELFALITGRRRTGRHRPDCVRSQTWSMFSPGRRPRRRGRFRTRV